MNGSVDTHRPTVSAPIAPPIDLSALLREKNPLLFDRLNGPSRWLLRWLACERRLNRELMAMPSMPAEAFPGWVLGRVGVSMTFPEPAELPQSGDRPVFVANHPTGGLDGLVLLHGLLRHFPGIKVVVTDLLMTLPPMRPFLLPVDRYQSSRTSVRRLHQAFAAETPLLIFPAGRTARRQRGRLTDFPWHPMPVTLGCRYGRPLVPLHIDADNSWRFHAVAAARRKLGIGLNLEMLLLVRELLSPATEHYVVRAGSAIPPDAVKAAAGHDRARIDWVRQQYEQLAEASE